MSEIVINVEKLTKAYRLGVVSYNTVSDDFKRLWAKLRGKEDPFYEFAERNNRTKTSDNNYVLALNNVNFEVKKGERLGIIGSNGAGKSTLLKILSQVTGPTSGVIKLNGRVGALLEVGTGFHPELTGRENIYMNGTILGMSHSEVSRKLDEIINFSGIERYIDTPLKRYSSGMAVRLGFAVAAHLEPEILIVDEVLAVGDAEFQKKAIGKMNDVSNKDGTTILFVSHNMVAIKSLCNNAILLENGEKVFQGNCDDAVHRYLTAGALERNGNINFRHKKVPTDNIDLIEAYIFEEKKTYHDPITRKGKIYIVVKFRIKENINSKYHVTIHFKDENGLRLFTSGSSQKGKVSNAGIYSTMCEIPAGFLNSITYSLDVLIIINGVKAVLIENDYLQFTVLEQERELGTFLGHEPGFIRPLLNWNIDKAE